MRLYNFINEETSINDISEIISIIRRNCKQYLNLIKGKDPLIRQMIKHDIMGIKKVRQDRIPSGMSQQEADYFNKWLRSNGHNRRDNSVMCISKPFLRIGFGDNFHIFPIGKFSYTFVEAGDINMRDASTGWVSFSDQIEHNPFVRSGLTDEKEDELEYYKLKKPFKEYFHTNEKFDLAYKKGYEMWINCNRYVYVRKDLQYYGINAKWNPSMGRYIAT